MNVYLQSQGVLHAPYYMVLKGFSRVYLCSGRHESSWDISYFYKEVVPA